MLNLHYSMTRGGGFWPVPNTSFSVERYIQASVWDDTFGASQPEWFELLQLQLIIEAEAMR